MAENIGTLAAKITADSAPFMKGMNEVKAAAKASVGAVTAAWKGGGGLRKMIMGDNMGSRLAGEMKGALGAIPFVGGALGAIPTSGSAFVDWIKEGLKEVKEMDLESRKLGLSIEEFGGLARLAGGDMEGFSKGLGKMRKNLGGIHSEAADAASAFSALGLSGMTLKDMSSVDAFAKIMEGLRGVTNEMDRAALASDIFGNKSYMAMTNAIAKGDKGIREAIESHKKLKGVIGDDGIADSKAALRAIKDIEDSITGVKHQLSVTAAPWITQIAKGFLEATKNGIDFKDIFENILRMVTRVAVDMLKALRGVRKVIDGFESPKETNVFTNKWGEDSWLNFGDDWVKDPKRLRVDQAWRLEQARKNDPAGFAHLKIKPEDLNDPLDGIIDNLEAFAEGMKLPGGLSRQPNIAGLFGGGIGALAAGAKHGVIDPETLRMYAEIKSKLSEQAKAVSMTADQMDLYKLKIAGATDAMLAQVKASQKLTEEARHAAEAFAEGKELQKQAQDPLAGFDKEIARMDEMFKAGAVGADGRALGIQKAFEKLEKLNGALEQSKLPELATMGSREAFRIIHSNEKPGSSNPQERVAKVMEAAKDHWRKTAEHAREIADAVKNRPEVVGMK